MKKVEVEWIDAQSSLEPIDLQDLKHYKVLETKSCGYLVYEDKEKIILVFMLFGDELAKHYQIIPKKMIKKIKTCT